MEFQLNKAHLTEHSVPTCIEQFLDVQNKNVLTEHKANHDPTKRLTVLAI